MSSRRRLATLVLGTTVVLFASAIGSYADSLEDPAPPASSEPATPEPTPEPTPDAAPEPTPVATPEATPQATPQASPDPTPEPTPEPTPYPTPAETPAPAAPLTIPAPDIAATEQSIQSTAKTAAVALNLTVEKVTRGDLPYTYRSGCPVKPSGLRLLRLTHYGFDKKLHRGEIVVRTSAVSDVSAVFKRALDDRFPIRLMRRVDRYHGSDIRSMEKDNTSAFNCRHVTGNPSRLSQHSYGNAVDVNTRENPYVTGSRVYPSTSRTYLNRGNVRKGMLISSGPIPKEFSRRGWPWGARWSHPDYQHFSSNGR